MSQENVEIVQRLVDAYNRRDAEAVAALLHREIEWHTLAGAIFGVESIHERDEVVSFMFEEVLGAMNDFRVVTEEVRELPGDQVIFVGHYEGRGVESGAEVRMDHTAIYRVEAGRVVFFQDFSTREEALEAVGLRE
jgi:ketosteroid isomerase-like protein